MKKCSKCRLKKDLIEFTKDKSRKDGYKYTCKKCDNKYMKSFKDRKKEYDKEYRKRNEDHIRKKKKEFYLFNKENISDYSNRWYTNNKEYIKEKSKEYYKNNKEAINKRNKEWYLCNRERVINYSKEYQKHNRDKINKYKRKRRNDSIKEKLNISISNGINKSLRGGKVGISWKNLVDFSLKDLKKHIENRFTKGMSWNNYGLWHIDHIVPKKVFEFESYKDNEFKLCWSLKNLQPMWEYENLSKKARTDYYTKKELKKLNVWDIFCEVVNA